MDALVTALAGATERLVVVLMGGSPVALPWVERVPALLLMGLSGQAAGSAMADVLFGAAAPAGRLAETWPLRLEDVPSTPHFAKHRRQARALPNMAQAQARPSLGTVDLLIWQVVYRETLNVGYRYFQSAPGRPVLFPFGACAH